VCEREEKRGGERERERERERELQAESLLEAFEY
jgi:hypothetical protein